MATNDRGAAGYGRRRKPAGGSLTLVHHVLDQLARGADAEVLLATVVDGAGDDAATEDLDAIRSLLDELTRERVGSRLDASRFELLADTVSDAVWDWDLRDGRVWRNAAMTTMFGEPPETLSPTAEPWTAAIHPDDHDEVVDSLRAALDDGARDWTHHYRMLRHDGTVAHVSARNRIIRDADGTALRIVGGITDISDRWEAEQALRINEVRYRELAEHSSEGIFLQVLHPERRFEYLNPAMEAMLGHSREAVYADPGLVTGAIPGPDRARMWQALEVAGPVTEPIDVDLRHRTGEVRRVRVRGVPLRDAHGNLLNVQAAVTDVTREHREQLALREALDQQRQLSELKTGFVQAVSHELRTPLTSIQGFVELLLDRELEPAEQRRYLLRVARGAARLHRLVTDVLDLDRFDRPDAVIDPAAVDLGRLARAAVDETDLGAHPIHLDVLRVEVVADGTLLERVVDNLVRNAVKHTPDGTPIWVRTRPPGTIVVEDAGAGIPAELREHVFEPFRQGPDQQDDPTPGIGIGLALTRRIVRLHGGDVVLDERPGGGCRFTVTLPGDPRRPPSPNPRASVD